MVHSNIIFIDDDIVFNNNSINAPKIIDHIVPKNIVQYLQMRKDPKMIGELTLPILEKKSILCYCKIDIIKRILNDEYTDNINDADIIFYTNVYDLEQLNKNCVCEKILIKYNSKDDYTKIIDTINFILNIIKCSQKNNKILNYDYKNDIDTTSIHIDYTKQNVQYDLKNNKIYLFYRNGTVLNDDMVKNICNDIYRKNCYLGYNCISYLINGNQENEPLIVFFSPIVSHKLNLLELTQSIDEKNDIIVGKNEKIMDYNTIIDYYTLLGKTHTNFGNDFILQIYDHYLDPVLMFKSKKTINNTQYMYDKDKFIRLCAYWYSINNYYLNKILLDKFILENNKTFKNKKIIILSKALDSYGGNQKVTLQMYNILIKNGYNVTVGCLKDIKVNNPSSIHNNDIKCSSLNKFVNIINNNFDLIIVNKLNEYFKIKHLIKINDIILTHNSLDPFDDLLVKHSTNISKILTVNTEHISILYDKGIRCPISRHINYIDVTDKIIKSSGFCYNITFVGRFSREKNLDCLLSAWSLIAIEKPNLTLTIIGSGDDKYINKINNTKNITYYGQQDVETIMLLLSKSDYLILPSYTEGLPFVILEAMSIGIPIICSDIIGPNSIVIENNTGFLIPLKGYSENKFKITENWDIMNSIDKHKSDNINNIKNTIMKAYNISFKQWKKMSSKCYDVAKKYSYNVSELNFLNNIKNLNNSDTIYNIKSKNTNSPLFMSKINRLQQECDEKAINRIDDNFGNHIIFSNIAGDHIKVNSICDLLFI
jgi:glycosyltransferase involved in cell wall biosynthesis